MGSIFLSWIFVATLFLGDIHQYQYLRSIRDTRVYDKWIIFCAKLPTLVLGFNIGQLVSGSHGQGSIQFRLWMFPRSRDQGRGSIQQTCCGVSCLAAVRVGWPGITRPKLRSGESQGLFTRHHTGLSSNEAMSHMPVACACLHFSVFIM